jgi:hypothetical protein
MMMMTMMMMMIKAGRVVAPHHNSGEICNLHISAAASSRRRHSPGTSQYISRHQFIVFAVCIPLCFPILHHLLIPCLRVSAAAPWLTGTVTKASSSAAPRAADAAVERQMLKEQMEALAELSRDVELRDTKADDDDEVCDDDVGFSASVLAAHAGYAFCANAFTFELS